MEFAEIALRVYQVNSKLVDVPDKLILFVQNVWQRAGMVYKSLGSVLINTIKHVIDAENVVQENNKLKIVMANMTEFVYYQKKNHKMVS
jgi:hypothetical protein